MGYNSSALRGHTQVGDPFLGGLIKGIGKGLGTLAGVGGSLLPGPIGGVLKLGGRILGGGAGPSILPSRPGAGIRPIAIGGGITLPGGAGVRGMAVLPEQRALPPAAAAGGGIPKGYRFNKSGYFTRDGQYHPPGTKLVRIRRTNPGNARALRRSLRRTESFVNLVKRTRKATRAVKTL